MNVVIVGGNRGIGLELCKQYKEAGHKVWGLCRKASREMQQLEIEVIESVDVANSESLLEAKDSLPEIDLLIHNSGIWRTETLEDLNLDTIREQFEINTLGPLRSVKAFLPLIKKGGKIVFISSRMGSIADNGSGGRYGYRLSKSALNSAARSLAVDLKLSGRSVIILHPGFVKTDMTEGHGDIDVHESVDGMMKLIEQFTLDMTGTFWHSDGTQLPW